MKLKTLEDLSLKNKHVLLRVAYDVPLAKRGNGRIVSDDSRIQSSLKTIKYLLRKNCKVILATWLGRPGGKSDERFSLDPVAVRLSELLNRKVMKLDASTGPVVRDAIGRMKPKDILLLENVRFSPEEEKGDMQYGKTLADYADAVIFDAFPQSHRNVPSTVGLLRYAKECAIGFDMQKELTELSSILSAPKRPFVVVLGGAKISDKIETFRNLLAIADIFLVGGAMCHNFLKSKGMHVGHSLVEEQPIGTKKEKKKIVSVADEIIASTKDIYMNLGKGLNVPKLVLPLDLVAADKAGAGAKRRVIDLDGADHIPWNWAYLDIGPRTVEFYSRVIERAKTVFWNGPLGYVEVDDFATGTKEIAKAVADSSARSILGGGDTEGAVRKFKLHKKFDYISTGGGAALEFLAGKELPVLSFFK